MVKSSHMSQALEWILSAKKEPLSESKRCAVAIELAGCMLKEAQAIQTPSERKIQRQLAKMMADPISKLFTTSLTDQCFRSEDPFRIANQLNFLIKSIGIPSFISYFKKIQLMAFKFFGKPLAILAIPLLKHEIRQEISTVILPGESKELKKHIQQRLKSGVRVNLNHLGEAILGEEEALHRLDIYIKDLMNPSIEYISIKISTIYSQINLLGLDDTLTILRKRLKLLYRTAKKHSFIKNDGSHVPKFVNLDMEEYRDLFITVELFRQVLEDPEFLHFSAGIVLQSYIPDSFLIQQELTTWAIERIAHGGAPIKIRIVKGANLNMECVEASLKNWISTPYATKLEVDANFKCMLMYGCKKEHAKAVKIGVASHNLFDIAYALLLRAEYSLENFIHFEMLEGMADHIRKVVQQLAGDILLYCPTATEHEFQNAIAYLVRRLDENTAPENFLRHAFNMEPGSLQWENQALLFTKSCEMISTISHQPRRSQNRFEIPVHYPCEVFKNEPDTDWTAPINRLWAEDILLKGLNQQVFTIPLVIGGLSITQTTTGLCDAEDPSFPGLRFYQYTLGGNEELELTITSAIDGLNEWSSKTLIERLSIMENIVRELKKKRDILIGATVTDTGKTVIEADTEVSEAIDFASYYLKSRQSLEAMNDVTFSPKGVVLVTPPWNFPCAISAGGIIASLAAGNSVIFKPAPEAVFVGWQLVNALWDAGVSRKTLQFFLCKDEPTGSLLIQDPRINVVILTGATATAKMMMELRKGKELIAETGGKNAIIVSRMADRDLALKDIIQSAFGYSGQKCSACSLVILEKEVYHDLKFRKQLKDATASLKVGLPCDLSVRINPLIHAPHPNLLKGLTELDPGEKWLLKPVQDADNLNLWSPGLKLGVKKGSFMHQTELFGPVVAIMCAKDIDEAIDLANGTPYGLTGGIHTLDEREQWHFAKRILIGNGYINRGITGAIVQRQPFGGIKDSCFGFGSKAGGPNYLFQLLNAEELTLPKDRSALKGVLEKFSVEVKNLIGSDEELLCWNASLENYNFYYSHYFSQTHDPSVVIGQDNILYYLPQFLQIIRFQTNDCLLDLYRTAACALMTKAPIEISLSPEVSLETKLLNKYSIHIVEETEEQLIKRITKGNIRKMRVFSPINEKLATFLSLAHCNIVKSPVLSNGRIELLHYLREMSLSVDYHRYGYLGELEDARVCQTLQRK